MAWRPSQQIPGLKPDVVTLDIEMPRNGRPRDAAADTEALSTAAYHHVQHPDDARGFGNVRGTVSGRRRLRRKGIQCRIARPVSGEPADGADSENQAVLRLSGEPLQARRGRARRAPERSAASDRSRECWRSGSLPAVPKLWPSLIPKIPADFPLPILIVQHMPAMFTRLLAETPAGPQPSAESRRRRRRAGIVPGRVFVAPGGYSSACSPRRPVFLHDALDQGPHENSCRPSVDVLFRSLAENYGGDVLPVVLTGMGSDGLRGTRDS